MPMSSAAESFGSFRPFPGNVGISARASEVRPRVPQADPASAAFEARRRTILSAGDRAPLERVGVFLLANRGTTAMRAATLRRSPRR
jgi:hypothetical protein